MGWTEWLVILTVAALLFRPRQLGRAAGQASAEFKAAANPPGSAPPPGRTPRATPRAQLLATLELPPEATADQIRDAWRTLAKVWHPDRFAHDPALRERATARLAAINAAYEMLTRASA